MSDAFAGMWRVHQDMKVPLRVAAYMVAINKVARAEMNRGFD